MDAVFNHHLYEYEKGLRRLILHTVDWNAIPAITEKLRRRGVAFETVRIGTERVNLFFGDETCIEVIRRIGKESLSDYTPEEDFILGIMLGYCREKQCVRYLKMKSRAETKQELLVG